MRKLIATLLSVLGIASTSAQPSSTGKEPVAGELRAMVLGLTPTEIWVTPQNHPHKTWGVLMETGIDDGYYTLVVLADGSTSLYFSTGGGVIGAGEHPKVRGAGTRFIGMSDRYLASSNPADSTSPPMAGETKFFFLTFDGIRTYSAPEVELGEERDELSPLFHAGHAVITEVRQHAK